MKTVDDTEKKSLKEQFFLLKQFLFTREGKISSSVVVGLFLLVLLVVKACEPAKRSTLHNICSAFLEQQLKYPEMMEQHYAEQYGSGIRVYYAQLDAFGQYLSEFIECSFVQDPQKGLMLDAVVFNTIKDVTKKVTIKNKGRLYKVEQEHIDRFNQSGSINAITSYKPD